MNDNRIDMGCFLFGAFPYGGFLNSLGDPLNLRKRGNRDGAIGETFTSEFKSQEPHFLCHIFEGTSARRYLEI